MRSVSKHSRFVILLAKHARQPAGSPGLGQPVLLPVLPRDVLPQTTSGSLFHSTVRAGTHNFQVMHLHQPF